jgi:hypothetical protein
MTNTFGAPTAAARYYFDLDGMGGITLTEADRVSIAEACKAGSLSGGPDPEGRFERDVLVGCAERFPDPTADITGDMLRHYFGRVVCYRRVLATPDDGVDRFVIARRDSFDADYMNSADQRPAIARVSLSGRATSFQAMARLTAAATNGDIGEAVDRAHASWSADLGTWESPAGEAQLADCFRSETERKLADLAADLADQLAYALDDRTQAQRELVEALVSLAEARADVDDLKRGFNALRRRAEAAEDAARGLGRQLDTLSDLASEDAERESWQS